MRYFQKIINYSRKKFNAKGDIQDPFVSNIDTSYLYLEEPEANQHRVKEPLEAADRVCDLSTGVKPFGKSIVPVFDPGPAGNSDTEVSSKEAESSMFDSSNASDCDSSNTVSFLNFGGLQSDKAEKLKSENQSSESSDGEETSSLKGSHSGPIADINSKNSINYNRDGERQVKDSQDSVNPDLLLFGKNHDAKDSGPEIKSYSDLHPVTFEKTVSQDKDIKKTDGKTLEPVMYDNRPAKTPENIKTSGRVPPEKGILPKGFAKALQQVQPELLQLPKPADGRENVLRKSEEPAVSPAAISQSVYIGRVSVTVKRKEEEPVQSNYSSAFLSAKPELSRYFMGDA